MTTRDPIEVLRAMSSDNYDQEEIADGVCCNCGSVVSVPEGYDFYTGDWCWSCSAKYAGEIRNTMPHLLALVEAQEELNNAMIAATLREHMPMFSREIIKVQQARAALADAACGVKP